jgi:hypothetical protein
MVHSDLRGDPVDNYIESLFDMISNQAPAVIDSEVAQYQEYVDLGKALSFKKPDLKAFRSHVLFNGEKFL